MGVTDDPLDVSATETQDGLGACGAAAKGKTDEDGRRRGRVGEFGVVAVTALKKR
jgi:hypothetical protein